jgi:molybdopterin synthase sulfur carrier subunit
MTSTMNIQIRYFASVRERLGPGERVEWAAVDGTSTSNSNSNSNSTGGGTGSTDSPEGPRTVGELRTWLIARSERHAEALGLARGLRTAYNQTLCGPDQPLESGAEVAFFPPVTGG